MAIRRETHPFLVAVEGESGPNRIEDIYITGLGFVMISIFNEDKGVTVNYICGEIEDFLPEKIKIKVEEVRQSSEQQPSKDDRFSPSL